MFAKDKVSQALIDAVNKVIGENKTETVIQPKQPVPNPVPQQLSEAGNVKIATSGGTKVLGHRYGNSAKTHRELMADPFAGAKGPKSNELEKIEKEKKKERSMDEELKGNQHKIDKNKNNKIDSHDFKILRGQKKSLTKMKEELDEPILDELINEVLAKDASAGAYIHDFIHSDNPKFAGKSKAKRKEMALGAYYSKKNEEVEQVEEQAPFDTNKDNSNFKKPNNPKRTGMDTARSLAQKAMKRLTGGSDKDQLDRLRKNMYGEESKPLTLSKEIAKKAYKKLKTETMMGKISN
jgi:hypothetical protein